MPEGLSTGLRVLLIGQAVRAPAGACGSSLGWAMQFDNGGRWRGNVQEQQKAPHCSPSITPSMYSYVFMLLSLPLVSLWASIHVFTVITLWKISLCMEELVVYLSSSYWEALDRAGEWCYLTIWDSPGVRGLFGEGKTRLSASVSSIPIAELENRILFIRETEWWCLLYYSSFAVNQGN